MKIKLTGKNLEDIRLLLPEFGISECDSGYDMIICHGGDGALLGAEREFPGVLKLPVRDSATALTCSEHPLRKRLADLTAGRLKITELPKLAAESGNTKICGINDIFLHNSISCGALRYQVRIDGELYAPEILGDGVGMSTVHGSTAYYRSITRSIFRTGVGLAFSNSTVEISHLVLPENAMVEISIIRGPGLLIADNSPITEVAENASVRMYLSDEKARICGLEEFMCPECRKIRHHRGNC